MKRRKLERLALASNGAQTTTSPNIQESTAAPVISEVHAENSSHLNHNCLPEHLETSEAEVSCLAPAPSMQCILHAGCLSAGCKILSLSDTTLLGTQRSNNMESAHERLAVASGADQAPSLSNLKESTTAPITSEVNAESVTSHSNPGSSAGANCLTPAASMRCILHPSCNYTSCRIFPLLDTTISRNQNCNDIEPAHESATLLSEIIKTAPTECHRHLDFNPTSGMIRPFSELKLAYAKKCSTFWKTSCWPEDVELAEGFEKALEQGMEQAGFHVSCYNLFTKKDRIERATQAAADEFPHKCIFCNNRRIGTLRHCLSPELAARIMATVAERKDQRLLDLIIGKDIVALRVKCHDKCYMGYSYNAPHVTQVRLPVIVEAEFKDYVANRITTVEVDGRICVPVTALEPLFVKTVADAGAYDGYDGKGGYLMANLEKYCPYPLYAGGKIGMKPLPGLGGNGQRDDQKKDDAVKENNEKAVKFHVNGPYLSGVDCLAPAASLQCILHPRCNRMSCKVFPLCDNTITQTQNCKVKSPNESVTLLPERKTPAPMECLQHLSFNPTTGLILPFSKPFLTRAKKCSTFWKTSCWPEDVTLAEQFEKALEQGSKQIGYHPACYTLFTKTERIKRATHAAANDLPSKCIFCHNRMKGKLLQCNTPELAARIIAGVAERKDQRLLDLIIGEDIVARRQAYHGKCSHWYLYNAPHVTQVKLPATVEAAFRDYVANRISTVEVDGNICVPVTALGTLFVKTVSDVGSYSGYDGKGGYLMANLSKYCPYPLCADGKIGTKLQPESCINGHGQEERTVWKHNGYAVNIRDSVTNLAGDCCIAPAQKSINGLSAQDWATLQQRIKARRQPSLMPKKSRSAAKLHKLMKQRRLERLASAGDAARKPTLPSIEELPVAPIISEAVKAPAAPVHCVLHRFCNPTDDTIIPPSDVTLVLAQKSKDNESAQERLAMASEAALTPTLPNIEELATAPITGEVHAKRSSYSIHSCSTEYLEAIKAPMTVPTKCLKHRICNSMSGKIIPFSDVTLTLAQKCSAFWKASCWPTDIAVAERFEKVLEQGREQLGYHSSCFRNFTGNCRLQLASLRAAEVFLDKCVFCFNLTSYCEKLWRCSTPELAARIMAAVAERKDKHLLNLIIGEDIVRRGLVYHVSCYTRYSYNDAHATQVRLPATVEAAFKDYMAKEITTLKVKNKICVPVTALGALFVKTVADAGAYDGYDDKGGYLMANLAKYCPYPLCAGGIIGPKVLPMSHVIEQDEDLEEDDAVWENNGEAVDFHDSVIDFVVEEDMDCLESCHDHASMYKNNQQKD